MVMGFPLFAFSCSPPFFDMPFVILLITSLGLMVDRRGRGRCRHRLVGVLDPANRFTRLTLFVRLTRLAWLACLSRRYPAHTVQRVAFLLTPLTRLTWFTRLPWPTRLSRLSPMPRSLRPARGRRGYYG